VDKETRDELIGRAIMVVAGVVSRVVWHLVTRAFGKTKNKKEED